MNRIPAREALLASGAVSVVASLCVLSGGGAAAQAGTIHDSKAPNAQASAPYYVDGHGASVSTPTDANAALDPVTVRIARAAALARKVAIARAVYQAPTPASTPHQSPVSHAPAPVAAPARPAPPAPQVVKLAAGSPRALAQQLAAADGWAGSQWTCLDELWQHESRYITTASNPSSGAYGIPQALPGSKMSTAGADWRTNPATQISWGLSYIRGRYGSPCGAWQYWLRHSSY